MLLNGDDVKMKWLDNRNMPIYQNTSKYIAYMTQETTYLSINNLQNDDRGNYTCRAENTFGEHSATTDLKVVRKYCKSKQILNVLTNSVK